MTMDTAETRPGIGRQVLKVSCVIWSLVVLGGCSMTPPPPADELAATYQDRCFIEEEQYLLADRLYASLGTLHLTERHLRKVLQWRDCEVQEALYRLRKIHGLP